MAFALRKFANPLDAIKRHAQKVNSASKVNAPITHAIPNNVPLMRLAAPLMEHASKYAPPVPSVNAVSKVSVKKILATTLLAIKANPAKKEIVSSIIAKIALPIYADINAHAVANSVTTIHASISNVKMDKPVVKVFAINPLPPKI